MKRFQSVLCALALTIALSSTVLAGQVYGVSAPVDVNSNGILVSEIYGEITDAVVSIMGHIHG